jgi:hypothetical protein
MLLMLVSAEKQKLMMAFFSILMVVKLIKVKLMFLLPLLLGVGAAKKLFLKTLLFLFPAFAHIFKFCAFYHAAHTKFHHHHHQVIRGSGSLTLIIIMWEPSMETSHMLRTSVTR